MSQWFSPGDTSWGPHWLSSLGDGDATSIGWINEKDAPKHPSPKTKDELNPNVKGDKVEKLCFSYKMLRAFERLFPDMLRPEPSTWQKPKKHTSSLLSLLGGSVLCGERGPPGCGQGAHMKPVISSIPDGSETPLRSQPGQTGPWWPFCFISHHHLGLNGRVGSCPKPGDSLRWQSCSPACQGLTGTVRTWLSSEEEAGGPGASCPYHFLSSLVCWVAHLRSRPPCMQRALLGEEPAGQEKAVLLAWESW